MIIKANNTKHHEHNTPETFQNMNITNINIQNISITEHTHNEHKHTTTET